MQRTLAVLLLSFGFLVACVPEAPVPEIQPTVTPIPTAPAAARPTYVVEMGTVQEVLEMTGRWLPRDQLDLSFEVTGVARNVNVRRDDVIGQGTLLADLQIENLEDELETAKINLETAVTRLNTSSDSSTDSVRDATFTLADSQLSLDNTVATSPWTQVENARITLQDAQIQLEEAQRSYNELISHPDSDPTQVDSAYEAWERAQTNLLTQQTNYINAVQTLGAYEFTVDQAENRVLQNQLNLQDAQTSSGSTEENIQAVNEAQLRIDQIEADIARSSLFSPIDGIVLEVLINPGDNIEAYNEVITVAIPDPKEAIINLPFNDTQRLSVGMVGKCQIANQPETAVGCVVRQVPLSNRDVDQTVRVAASLDEIPNGQLIEVEMPLDVREDVMWLPPEAVRTFQNRTFVVLQTPDGEQISDVQLGLQTDDRVEIESGVSVGDIVVGP